MTVYRKTSFGKEILQSNNAVLSVLERGILVLVNGRLSIDELTDRYSKLGNVPALLSQLEGRGLIEIDPDQLPLNEEDLKIMRDEITTLIEQQFGFMATPLVERAKRCDTKQELVKCLEHCRDVMREAQSERKANVFWELARQCLRM